MKKPSIAIIIPTLGRPEGLKRMLQSIERLDYPKSRLIVKVIDDSLHHEGVPKALARGVLATRTEWIVYGANDTEFDEHALKIALKEAKDTGFIAFNTGEVYSDEGNICEHFMIKRSLLKEIGGEIFDTDFFHVGVDNLLWAKMKKLGRAKRSQKAIMFHHHFSKGFKFDEVYQIGWAKEKVAHDRKLLAKKLEELGLN